MLHNVYRITGKHTKNLIKHFCNLLHGCYQDFAKGSAEPLKMKNFCDVMMMMYFLCRNLDGFIKIMSYLTFL